MRFAGNRIFAALALVVIAAGARGAVELGIDVLESNGYALLKNKRVGLITNQTEVDLAASGILTAINIYELAEMNRQLRTNLITRRKRGKREMFFKCYGSSSIALQLASGIGPAGFVASWAPEVVWFKGERSQYLIY